MSELGEISTRLHARPQPISKIGKSERTRAAILDAGLEFVWSRPFRDMTVGELMAVTGLSRSAFYQYFDDLHDLMQSLLDLVKDEVYAVTRPWFHGVGDPVVLVNESLSGLVRVCYRLGPIIRAADHAAASDERLEKAWKQFVEQFDDAIVTRIEADQEQGLVPAIDARPVAIALNRLDVYTLIEAFGERPRSKPGPVHGALAQIWISTLYGSEWVAGGTSNLIRT